MGIPVPLRGEPTYSAEESNSVLGTESKIVRWMWRQSDTCSPHESEVPCTQQESLILRLAWEAKPCAGCGGKVTHAPRMKAKFHADQSYPVDM